MTTQTDDAPAPSPRRGRRQSQRRWRWIELIPPAILAVALAVLAIDRPNAVRDLFSSTQAILVTVGIVAGWLLLSRVVLPRLVHNVWLRVGALSAVAIALVLVLIVPSIRDEKVVEKFPGVATEPAPRSPVPGSDDEPAPEPADEPVQLAAGSLAGIDHDASGTATIYRQPDGSYVVGLENIDVEPGPDYQVYVSAGAGRDSPDGAVHLDALKGNQGTQFYPVPAGNDLETGEWTVLIWCRAFAVPIASSTPVPV